MATTGEPARTDTHIDRSETAAARGDEPTTPRRVPEEGRERIHTVLLDADGVVQRARPGWRDLWDRHAAGDAEAFAADMFDAELPALAGKVTIQDAIERRLRDTGRDPAAADDVVSAWSWIEVFPDAFDLVDEIRAGGTRCMLASNQQAYRRDVMLGLGYADHFDHLYFSCDLGVAKPDPAYFAAIVADLGGTDGVVFVDDRADNVAAARSVGLRAYVHDTHDTTDDHGLADLRRILVQAGVTGLDRGPHA